MRRALAGGLFAVAVATSSCSNDEPPPPRDPDALVLTPAKDGGVPHLHIKQIGNGTRSSAGGYRLTLLTSPRGTAPRQIRFQVLDRSGTPLKRYLLDQTKRLHLYAVREDYQDYRHLHPTMSPTGTWTTLVDITDPGRYRLIAEFAPPGRADGGHVVLSHDFTIPGRWTPQPVPTDATASDGIVELAAPRTVTAGSDQTMTFTVSDDNGNLVNLGSYLGTYAHLTGFDVRTGRFVHAHPLGAPEPTSRGSELTFHVTLEHPGEYRFFVQLRVDGFVHALAVTSRVRAA